MTPEQAIKLVEILATIITAYFVYKSRQDIGEVKAETKEQTKSIGEATISTKETARKADVIIDQGIKIDSATNGHLSRVTEEFREMRVKFEATQRMVDMLIADKRTQQVVAEKLAEKATPTPSPATLKLKEAVVIEGSLETAGGKEDAKLEGTLETKE